MMSVVDVQRLGIGLTVFCEGDEKKKKIGQVLLLQSLEIRISWRCEKRRNVDSFVCLFCREEDNLCRFQGLGFCFVCFLSVAKPPMICGTFRLKGENKNKYI